MEQYEFELYYIRISIRKQSVSN